ncbi:hypothetical protein TBR22_A46040 [Luteitalea sp. TBR-22]|uniref:DUF1553 domain-containing protein n=1 Tax=Luteitalea sp. TBR-22 TaxID=2802971 RepID=UPI001AF773C3|nr:DUF1553 domain-containing protein [Luteitalea sp. TBR-22]BCS35377.1 hypothetical protein TBR22_A46040 [Luteitalea sp. TBR-22]
MAPEPCPVVAGPLRVARRPAALLFLAAVLAGGLACRPAAPRVAGVPDQVDFNFHVRPILSDKCFACHGPDDRARKGGLSLHTREGAFATLADGRRAVVPGSTRKSELVRRILSTDPAVMMPVPDSHLSLTDVEKATLVRWIEQGATWTPHWAFVAPKTPAIPTGADLKSPANPIDAFVRAGLRGTGLAPSPEAPKETLIRRVSIDLTGLPPTVAEVDAFLADTSPDAYEKVVDRLLASPAFGERMAADWLDVARYADSHGYQDDGMRQMHPWRDWVIKAFNRNMPVDEFITWQLAGDLLPNATVEQRLATAFNRNHMQSQEGGIVSEEYRTEYVADRVNTFGSAFLGLTLQCARCHDHKYDPVLQQDYFKLFAFFNNVNETGQIPYSGMPSPTVTVSTPEADAELAALRAAIGPLEQATRVDRLATGPAFEAWLARAEQAAAPVSLPRAIVHLPLDAMKDYTFANLATPQRKGTVGSEEERKKKTARAPEVVPGRVGSAVRLVGDSQIDLGGRDEKFGFFERNEPFSFALWLRRDKDKVGGPIVTRSGAVMNGHRGYELILRPDGTLTAGLHHVAPDNSLELETLDPFKVGTWYHVAVTYDGSSRGPGLRLYIDGAPARTRLMTDNLARSIISEPLGDWGGISAIRLGRRGDENLADTSIDEFMVFPTQLTAPEVATLATRGADGAGVGVGLGRRAFTRDELAEHWVLRVAKAGERERAQLRALRGKENAIITKLPQVMVMRDLPAERARPTFVLARGAYDAPTTRVEADTPAMLPRFDKGLPRNRLGLARWLVSKENPLATRVLVNRYWALLFGTGLVATPEDFGNQGKLPTHPQLLDYLAVSFRESGWNLKALLRRIVTSQTYRQSSAATPQALEIDPANEKLARGPGYRLSAEQIRDNALAASGLLVRTIGGPSVYPYQPPGLWEELATRNATTYAQGKGDDLHRRSLYTVWKRSTPPPSAISFDASERLLCTVRRQRTSTPLQALVLLNDVQYVEAARVLAERVLLEGGDTPEARITLAWRLLTSRAPRPSEVATVRALHDRERARFAGNPKAARTLATSGEHPPARTLDPVEVATWTVVASTIMNTDEAVNKR